MSAHLCSKLEADLTQTRRHGNRLGDIHDTAGAVHEGREGLCSLHRAHRTNCVRIQRSSVVLRADCLRLYAGTRQGTSMCTIFSTVSQILGRTCGRGSRSTELSTSPRSPSQLPSTSKPAASPTGSSCSSPSANDCTPSTSSVSSTTAGPHLSPWAPFTPFRDDAWQSVAYCLGAFHFTSLIVRV